MWDRKVEGNFPELKVLVSILRLCHFTRTSESENGAALHRSNGYGIVFNQIDRLAIRTSIPDVDVVIQTFKACLRISHQHLQAATLHALPPLLPLLLSNPFLPTGGIIDRLGDARERTREKARESLVILGGLAFRAGGGSTLAASKSGKTQETALQMFERLLKEIGLASKAWRIREQSILTLVDIRRAHHLFPIRPYLPILVGTLEDSDSTVRETAKTSVIVLFTGPGVSDAARADLKRELTKKGVRKTIVDNVLAKEQQPGEGVEATDVPQSQVTAKKGYIPPSLALQAQKAAGGSDILAPGPNTVSRMVSHGSVKELSRPTSRTAMASPPPSWLSMCAPACTIVASSKDLDAEFTEMLKSFDKQEHNWAPRDRAVTRVRGMLKGDVHIRYSEAFVSHLKLFVDASLKTLASLRTIVATNTCSLYNELAVTLGTALDPYKIVAQITQSTVGVIITNTSPQPRTVVPIFWSGLQDKTPQGRAYAIEHVKTYLDVHGHACIRKALSDANAGVRQNARATFWTFEGLWKERGRVILEAQEGTNRKQLEKGKSSVAAAIAASRAKAKAIATAPPTLRHQATSAARTMSPPKRSLSPSLSTGSLSGKAAPSSPTAPLRSRIPSNPAGLRIASGSVGTRSHSRTSSGDSSNSASYPGSRIVPAPFSSPPRGSVIRQAMQTALPSSPPPRFSELEQSASFARQSVYLPNFDEADLATNDLLTAVAIPLPDDGLGSKSRTDSQSPTSNGHQPVLNPSSNMASLPVNVPQPVVEDALRARAEQAQSAAERLLELVEPEDEIQVSTQTAQTRTPATPISKNAAIWKQAAAFRDSPAHQAAAPSLMTDMLRPTTTRADGAWWKKRMAHRHSSCRHLGMQSTLKSLASFCVAHPSVDAISPLSSTPRLSFSSAGVLPSLKPELWSENRSFSRLFNALQKFLSPDKNEELLEYGLIVLWEMLEGHEAEVFTILLTIRYSNLQRVFEATNTLRDALAARVEAVYGLTTLHAALVSFRATPVPPPYSDEAKASSYAFGLIALAKFALRLPAEVLEDELPRLKHTLITALTDTASLVVREAAAAAIIAAQVVLRDDAHLFALLDGLADDKKNLLTYLFDKHGVRGVEGSGSVDRLEREMRRLDGRTGTPVRASTRSS
ncbi:clasp N terminal-domain-containing protein [Lactarius sanguifluus]|nr:clasp N terminal-domain-containing protein [Lactarius sanguifluus]